MSDAKRHRHEFTLLYWHFGPYGDQTVHVHTCYAGCWDGPLPDDRCQRVLIGRGRECDGDLASHEQFTLTEDGPRRRAA